MNILKLITLIAILATTGCAETEAEAQARAEAQALAKIERDNISYFNKTDLTNFSINRSFFWTL